MIWKSKSECFKVEVISGFLSPYQIACMAMFTKIPAQAPQMIWTPLYKLYFKRTVKSIFVIPHAASKTFIQLTGHVWLWETPENCFFSVLFVMSRSVSFLTIVCLVANSFIQSRDETYYNKVFRNRDCIPLTGACWILGFAVAISPFSSSRNEFNLL